MSKVISNRQLSRDFYEMRVAEPNQAKMGQFYMLRAWDDAPLLSRPISVFDADAETLTFLYKVIGKGTELLAQCKAGDEIQTGRALGNSFPLVSGKIALVGGGVGIAPLYLAAKTLKKETSAKIDIYLGFSDEALLQDEYAAVCDKLFVNVGGFITDEIDPAGYDCVFTCGPEIMMRVLYDKCRKTETQLYASLERKMACGFGVCLGCACDTTKGRKKVCTDGPVFPAEEVF